MSLRLRPLNVDVETKTKDNVTINVVVAVQYCVHQPEPKHGANKNDVFDDVAVGSPLYQAFYSLSDVTGAMNNYVENVVRGAIPRMDLDDVFSSKDTLNTEIKDQLEVQMKSFGYEIKHALIVDLRPAAQVTNAMNEINAQARRREAANYQADAAKISQVKAAEADAQSKYLSGMGVAKQRQAIVQGLQSTVSEFSSSVKGATAADVLDVLLMTQWFDMLKVTARNGGGGTLFLPHGPKSISSLRKDLAGSFASTGR